jgi:MoaA/NifB/PqqE/SkfB family radical SAM enzyme
MFYSYDEIRDVHLEISSFCNAECPMCPRNLHGYPYNEGYTQHNMTLEEAKKIFPSDFVAQLARILINGNFGDMVMNPESLDIIRYFRTHGRPDLSIAISTNAGARNKEFWTDLAAADCHVAFCLDGLEDTHSMYRRNTLYSTVLKNAQTFIEAGGQAWWKYIVFDHNAHQVEQARKLSQELGFKDFVVINQNRDNGPVYDREGRLVYIIGKLDFEPPKTVAPIYDRREQTVLNLSNVKIDIKKNIDCEVKKSKSIYINSIGEAYPCCYVGHNPRTYGRGSYMGVANRQVRELVSENSALEHGIANVLSWFDSVEASWNKSTIKEGRLIHCNDKCGCN